ncbi:MAG: hypothetical protein HC855_05275 [Rhizobiales bacterium]|nr:hypothetical protein [Hyphomicrobiales bacterium]
MRTGTSCLGVRRAGPDRNSVRWAGRRIAGWMARRAANVALSGFDDCVLKDMGVSRRAIELAIDGRD